MALGIAALPWFRPGLSYRTVVNIECDDGRFVDFNTEDTDPDAPPANEIHGVLLQDPVITVRTEGRGRIYMASLSSLKVRNNPWAGNAYGFWDAPLPITLKRGSNTYVYSTFYRRRCWVRLEARLQDYTTVTTESLGMFVIEDILTDDTNEATIKLASLQAKLMDRSAVSVKNGAEWFKSVPIGPLMERLIKAADGAFSVSGSVSQSTLDMGTLPEPRATSWGKFPGVLEGGDLSNRHFIPRHLGASATSEDEVVVGCELPGENPVSGGALCLFNAADGRTKILRDALDAGSRLTNSWPIFAWKWSSTLIIVASVREHEAANHDYFYTLDIWAYNPSSDSETWWDLQQPFWPARWSLMRGEIGYITNFWYRFGTYNGSAYSGENFPLPFPQRPDSLLRHFFSRETEINQSYQWNTDSLEGENDEALDRRDSSSTFHRPGGYGAYMDWAYTEVPTYGGGLRYWMTDSWHGPCVYGDGVDGGERWLYWIANQGQDAWRVYGKRVDTGSVVQWYGLDNLRDASTPDDHHFYDAQITAYCVASEVGTQKKMLVATLEHDYTATGGAPTWRACLWLVNLAGVSSGQQVPSHQIDLLWYSDASNYSYRTIVGLTSFQDDPTFGKKTHRYVAAVIFNRLRPSSTPYRVAIFDAFSLNWESFPGITDDAAPVSGRPFSGFTLNTTDGRIYFVDQATGHVWSVNPTALDWRLENNAFPAHSKEHYLAAVNGLHVTPDGNDTILWGFSPGPHGDVANRYWETAESQPSRVRRVRGLYPLVQFSTKVTDCVDVADFSGLKVWQALQKLMELLPKYTMLVDSSGVFWLQKRVPGLNQATVLLLQEVGIADLESNELGVDRYAKRRLYDEVVNSVDVTPHELQLIDPELEYVRSPDSQFGGAVRWSIGHDRPMRITLECVAGGDILQQSGGKSRPIMFRYARLLETIQVQNIIVVGESQTYAICNGLIEREARFWSGDQEIRIGSVFQAQDGTKRTITDLSLYGDTAVRIDLNGSIGVDGGLPAYSEITITPPEGESVSDSPDGVTTLTAAVGPSDTEIEVADASMLAAGQFIVIREEPMRIRRIYNGTTLVVQRDNTLGFTLESYDAGLPVKAYVGIQDHNAVYPVGNTGVFFGMTIDSDEDEDAFDSIQGRSVLPGDRVIITTRGYSLEPVEHAVIRKVASESINKKYGHKDLAIPNNRFLDRVRAEIVAIETAAEMKAPRTLLSGLSYQIWPGINGGQTVSVSIERLAPVEFDAEIVAAKFDIPNRRAEIEVRSFEEVGAVGIPSGAGGAVIRRGQKGAEHEEEV